MKWFTDLKILKKLSIAFTLIIFSVILVGYLGYSTSNYIGDLQNDLYTDKLLSIRDLAFANISFLNARLEVRKIVATKDMDQRNKIKETSVKYADQVNKNLESYLKTEFTKEEEENVTKFKSSWKEYQDVRDQVFSLALQMKDEEALKIMNGDVQKIQEDIGSSIRNLIDIHVKQADALDKETDISVTSSGRKIIIVTIITIIFVILILVLLKYTLVNPILKVKDLIQKMLVGNLRDRLKLDRKDEIGEMSSAMDNFSDVLSGTVLKSIERIAEGDLTFKAKQLDSSDQIGPVLGQLLEANKLLVTDLFQKLELISESSKKLLGISQQFAASTEQMSANITTVSSSAEEMASSIQEISTNTTQSSQIAHEATEKASAANLVMDRLGTSSLEIGNIVKVITSIAEQTNLLALNATIEAARAGELGKGFAVVANEVKELAKESAKATEDITGRIKMIQEDSKNAINAIREIIEINKQVFDISNTIASAVEEQTVTTSEITRNITEVSAAANEISKSNVITETASNLQKLANELDTFLKSKYKI